MEAIDRFLSKGSGSGDGYGYGSGYGSGSGSGYGYGSGYGDGDGIKKYNNQTVYYIDQMPTLIHIVKNNYAKASLINKDLTMNDCYVAKCGDFFAHGKTLKEARSDAERKYNENQPIEFRIAKFLKEFSLKKKYKAEKFYIWHTILTGSCTFGKDAFIKSHGIKLTDYLTVSEFLDKTKNEYGGEIIKQIIKKIGA